jgi:hypothetical protein
MTTKTATKTNRNAKAASKATTTKATKKNATVAKPASKEPKPADKWYPFVLSQPVSLVVK